MSRHRRQASQVLPPEILAGNEDFTKSCDLTQQVADHVGTTKSATISTTNQPHQERQAPSPVTTAKKLPPPGKST
ncbi:hypothetical protein D0Y65_053047 [Glycine soja]|uniref:Uncharacterized protein n=1 Tax=Glycine soja TaxID=3848 RepID=A0A0B2Q3Y2_GLYSO|nr:hypothetical protein glysoja_047955 [Glycine soja]RZB42303.1 hypothetical protein D0Y65_053047 [Glycine soja]